MSKPNQTTQPQTTQQPPTYSYPSAYSPKIKSSIHFDPLLDRTKQSFKDECDINVILRRYAATGQLDHLNLRTPLYGEIQPVDFQQAMGLVVEARAMFQALPAEVRDRFQNDPAKLLAFVSDEKNRPEAERLGLVVKKSTPPAPAPEVVEKSGEQKP